MTKYREAVPPWTLLRVSKQTVSGRKTPFGLRVAYTFHQTCGDDFPSIFQGSSVIGLH
jgi:hypothetical protein